MENNKIEVIEFDNPHVVIEDYTTFEVGEEIKSFRHIEYINYIQSCPVCGRNGLEREGVDFHQFTPKILCYRRL